MNADAQPQELILYMEYTSTKNDGKDDVELALPTLKEELDLYKRRAQEEKEKHFVVLNALVLDMGMGMGMD